MKDLQKEAEELYPVSLDDCDGKYAPYDENESARQAYIEGHIAGHNSRDGEVAKMVEAAEFNERYVEDLQNQLLKQQEGARQIHRMYEETKEENERLKRELIIHTIDDEDPHKEELLKALNQQ